MDVFFDSHLILNYLHILGMVYWLGADLGVYYASRYVADATLPTPERLRFAQLLLRLDVFPRTALILMLPIGFHLADQLALIALPRWGMSAIWLAALGWFALLWMGHGKPAETWLAKADWLVRLFLVGLLAGTGVFSLWLQTPIQEPWLAMKLVLFAGVIALGLTLRQVVAQWRRGFALLDSDAEAGNGLIAASQKRGARQAQTLWALLILMGFLGSVKPFFAV
jgi:hypothetical protein